MQHEKLQHWKKCNMEIMQLDQSARKKECNTKKVQHGKSTTWKKCNMEKVTRVKYGKKSAQE